MESWLDRVIDELLLKIEVPITLKGFAHTNRAIKILLSNPEIPMKELYHQIAATCNITPSAVERNIRGVVNSCVKNQTETYTQLFSNTFKVTNSMFLAMITRHIKLDISLDHCPYCQQRIYRI